MTVLRSGVATDIGRARRSNEDRAAAGEALFAVADGMGGARGGEVAARLAIETLEAAYEGNPTVAGLREAFKAANSTIWEQSVRVEGLRGMGTTLTAAGLTIGPEGREIIVLANVGDSRAYLMSDGSIRQITADHSLAEERVRHGEMTEAEAEVHPQRHILTRALGVLPEVDIDLWELRLRSGDRLLLCSDGLSNEVGADQIGQVLRAVSDPRKAARALVDRANANGGSDNVTVVVIDVLVGEETPGLTSTVAQIAGDSPLVGASADGARATTFDEPGDADLPPSVPEAHDDSSLTAVRASVPGSGPPPDGDSLAGEELAASSSPVGVQTLEPPEQREPEPEPIPAPKESRRARRRRLGLPRRITIRVVLFLVLVLAVPAGAWAVVRWYAMDNWYVAVDHGDLAVYQGRPGGFMGFEPKLLDRTTVTTKEVMPIWLPALHRTVSEPSLAAGVRYIANLHQEFLAHQNTTALSQL